MGCQDRSNLTSVDSRDSAPLTLYLIDMDSTIGHGPKKRSGMMVEVTVNIASTITFATRLVKLCPAILARWEA